MSADILAQFGVGGDELPSQLPEGVSYPTPVQGRVAHIDADFLAYQVSAETRDELDGIKPRKSLEDMQHNAREAVDHLMRCAGGTSYVCHLTPSGSTKGGRPEQAVQKEYQSNRKDREKPEFLDAIRHFIAQELNGIPHLDQEADDGMAQANYDAMGPGGEWGNSNLSVIVSKDKDLRMVPGLHFDFDSGELFTVGHPFGSVYLKEKLDADGKVKSRKLLGWGTKFFWAQCLMGDPADSIKGLPAVSGRTVQGLSPSKAYNAAFRKWADNEDPEKEADLSAKLDGFYAKPKQVGPVMAYDLLKDVQNDRDAFQMVKRQWEQLAKDTGHQFTHWRTGKSVTPTQALLGDMLLLWMRRNKNPTDVIEWIKETCT